MELTWTGGDTEFRWPWLMVGLGVLVVVLLVLWLRVWWRRPPRGASYVAHAARLRALPRYRALVRQRTLLGALGAGAALVACAGAIVLGGRLEETRTMERSESARDIMLCLDASGSTAPWNVDVVEEFQSIAEGLQGERIGLTVWNNVALSKFPLTDDYEFIVDRLEDAEEAFAGWNDGYPTGDFYDYTAGTFVNDFNEQSSLVADGLVSCVQRFDRLDEDRGRALILATDSEQRGKGVYDLGQAGKYAVEHDIVVHAIANPGEPQEDGDLDGLEALAEETGGTYALLGTGGSTDDVVSSINELEAAKVEKPPLVQTLDRPGTGTAIAGIGVGLLVLVWVGQGVLALLRRGSR